MNCASGLGTHAVVAVLQSVPLLPMSAEFGSPPWLFGLHSYEVLAGGSAVLAVYGDPAAAGRTIASS